MRKLRMFASTLIASLPLLAFAAPAAAQPETETPAPPETPEAPPADEVPAAEEPPPPPGPPPPPAGYIDPTPYRVHSVDQYDDDEGLDVLVHGPLVHGGFGGPSVMASRVYGSDALFVGGRGGWIANHVFVLGGGGYGLVTSIAPPQGAAPTDTGYDLTFGYGGLWLEGIVLPTMVVHGTVGTLLGAGGVGVQRRHHDGAYDNTDSGSDAVFVAEPTLAVELSVTRFMRLDATASYRLVRGVDMVGLENADLSGFAFGAILKFGKF